MAIKSPKPEEIVVKLRQVEVLMGQLAGHRTPVAGSPDEHPSNARQLCVSQRASPFF